jgi:hypothetical protein
LSTKVLSFHSLARVLAPAALGVEDLLVVYICSGQADQKVRERGAVA